MNKDSSLYFGQLFKRFRLKSEFETLSQLADVMAVQGFSYEDSIYSRWEHGNRIPKNRNVLIALIKLFVERDGMRSLHEANLFLESAGHGYLTEHEAQLLPEKIAKVSPFLVPRNIPNFIGRNEYILSIRKSLLKGGAVLIYGVAGCGKTALSINLAHALHSFFPDGVLWFRLDISSPINILKSILESYGKDASLMQDLGSCSSYVRSFLSSKRVLIIFDNANADSRLDVLLPNSKNNSVVITSQSEKINGLDADEHINLHSFTEDETLTLFKKILGNNYTNKHKPDLLKIASSIGYLPLAINLIAQQLNKPYVNLIHIVEEIRNQNFQLSQFIYENKNLYIAIKLSYDKLPKKLQQILTSVSIFEGKDFPLDLVSSINQIHLNKMRPILAELANRSLIEYSSTSRYRLHPVIKLFLYDQIVPDKYYQRAIIFYINFFKTNKGQDNYFLSIQPEIFNATSIFERSIDKLKYKNSLFYLWREINNLLWFNGYWTDFLQLNYKVYQAASGSKRSLLKLHACIDLACVHYWLGKLEESEKYAKEALIIAKLLKNSSFIAQAQDRLGKIYQLKNNIDESIKNLKSALNYLNKTVDFEKIGNVLRHIAEGYLILENFNKAEKYLNFASTQYLKINDPSIRLMYQALINSHLGITMFKQKKYKEAEKLFISSLSFEEKAGGRAGTKIGSKLGLGLLYEKRRGVKKAQRYYIDAKKEIGLLGIRKEVEKLNVCMSILKKDLNASSLYNSKLT